jgi:hypothetical protein
MSNPNEEDSLTSRSGSMKASFLESSSVAQRQELLREILPACQPQEGSPANTFTASELHELQAALAPPNHPFQSGKEEEDVAVVDAMNKLDIRQPWSVPEKPTTSSTTFITHAAAPYTLPCTFRHAVRAGAFIGPTNGVCPGYLQCNLVVLPAGKIAFDFLLFCQRNSKACPLLEVCEGASSFAPKQLAEGADLRTDVPKYVQ